MKNYSKPRIVTSLASFSFYLQGTGVLDIDCRENTVLCDTTLDISCEANDWTVVFLGQNEGTYGDCHIIIGNTTLSDCRLSVGPFCNEGRFYALTCTASSCLTIYGTPIYIECGGERATCRAEG